MRGTAKLAAAAASTVALALAVGCAGGSGPSAASESTPADVLALMASDVTGSLQKIADVTAKAKSTSISMHVTYDDTSIVVYGVMSYGDSPQAEITVYSRATGSVAMRIIGGVQYVEITPDRRATVKGKKWMKIDLGALTGQTGTGDITKQLQDMDPSKHVRLLLDSGPVKATAGAKVNDVLTVNYTGTAPIDTYLTLLDPKTQAQARKELLAQGVTEITTDLWVDENYLPRLVRSVGGTMETEIRYTDFGNPVSVAAPPAAETVDLAEMLKT